MGELVGGAAEIEQCEAGEGGGRSRPTVLRLRPEARLERFQLLAEGAFAPLQRAALLALAAKRVVGPRQPLLDRGSAVCLPPHAPLQAGGERAEGRLVGGATV